MNTTYLMESDDEGQRLEAKTIELQTICQLELVGLQRGMRALDAGAGTGAVARVMAMMVGEEGRVTALDLSEKRLNAGRALAAERSISNLDFCRGDLHEPGVAEGSFDFVWCRFVFEYLADPERALASLIALARPGGSVVVGDLDGNGVFHDPLPERLKTGIDRLCAILAPDFDPFAGRKLYGLFARAGLDQIRVHCLPYHVYAGAIPANELENWEQKLSTIRPIAEGPFGGRDQYDSFAEEYLSFLKDPLTFTYSILLLVQGVKP